MRTLGNHLRRSTQFVLTAGILLISSFLMIARAATITVTSTNDTIAVDGDVSLREAIESANSNADANADVTANRVGSYGTDTIEFNIPPLDTTVKTITPTNALPDITDALVIDGYTQTNSSPNTLANGDNAVLLVELDGSQAGGVDGLTLSAGNSTVRGLVVYGYFRGINLTGIGTNVVEGCFLGPDSTGTNAPGNSIGVQVSSGNNDLIGGTNAASRNVISGNSGDGVNGAGGGGGTTVLGNFVGVDRTGTNSLGNGNVGVFIQTASPTIGGTNAGARNVISGNDGDGVSQTSNLGSIEGNLIGTDVTGTKAIGNNIGVAISGTSNTVGGATASSRNIISGNRDSGVYSAGSSAVVQGNFIGTDVSGTTALPNANGGLRVDGSPDNLLGGTTPVPGTPPGNVISGNTGDGVILFGASRNRVEGNIIGADAGGTNSLGNSLNGVEMTGDSNVVGGTNTLAGNLIAYNGTDLGSSGSGIFVPNDAAATNNAFLGNSILANGLLGIDLRAAGESIGTPTTNDVCDTDDGANHLQNFPVLTLASNNVSGVLIQGVLDSAPNTTFRLEFFANAECDPSGHGEGEIFIGFTNVTTDANCTNLFSVSFSTAGPLCGFITATATETNSNNTSEFSACLPITADDVCVAPPSGLIHWYPGDTDGRDLAGANTGTLESGATAGNPGKVDGAFEFDANGSGGVNLGDVSNLDFGATNSFTIEAWISYFGASPTNNDAQSIIVLNNDCGNTLQTLQLQNTEADLGRVFFEVRDTNNTGGLIISPSALSSNQFHHVAGVREVVDNTKTLKLYVDGVLVATTNDQSTGSLALNADDLIGRRNLCGTLNVFNGLIDEVEIYNRALTDTEIDAIFCAGTAGKCKPADLAVSKTDSPDPVGVGNNLTYTIIITNRGPNTATSVVLTDTLPGQANFVSASSGCNEVGGVVTCNLGTLASAGGTNVTIVVTPTTSGSITNTAEVGSAVPDFVTTNDIVTAVTTVNPVPNADLAVSKTDSPDPVSVGSNVTYIVTVTNRGPDEATLVVLVDTLPTNVNFVSASSGCGDVAGVVTCNLGTLASGTTTNVSIVVTTTISGLITNTAEVSSVVLDTVSTNDTATAITTVNPLAPTADLAVSKTDSPDPVTVGSNLTYTITITNRGPDTATSVVLTDTLPDDVSFVSASTGCGQLAGVVTCNLGTLASGAKTNVSIVVTTLATGSITNTAEVSSVVTDSVATNDIATAVTTVSPTGPTADLAVTKTDSPDPVGVGNNLTYTITVTNRGPNTAISAVLMDTLPEDVTFVSASTGCGQVAGVVTCNLGNFGSGATTNVTIVVTPTSSGSITNIVEVDSNVNDPNSVNNTAQQVTTVLGPISGIDLTGTWSNVVATCKNENGKVKGKIIIENLGTEDALTSFVKFYLSDDDQFDGTDVFLKQIATGKVKTDKVKKKNLSASLKGECFTGKFIIAVIDAEDTVEESNEANNEIVFGPLP